MLREGEDGDTYQYIFTTNCTLTFKTLALIFEEKKTHKFLDL